MKAIIAQRTHIESLEKDK